MSVLWQQWVNGFDSEQEDTACSVTENPTLLASDTNEITCIIASADDSHDRAVASILTSASLPQTSAGGWRGRIQLVGATTLANNSTILRFNNLSSTRLVDVYLNSSLQINWFSDALTIDNSARNDTSTFALSVDTWYWLELQWLCAGGSGYKKLWINTDPTLVGGANSPTISAATLTGTAANVQVGEARFGIDHLDGVQVSGYTIKIGRGQMNDGAVFVDLQTPTNTSVPTILGTLVTPTNATCSPGSWTGSPSLSYQWKRSNGGGYANISGATGQSYALLEADVGYTLECDVTATNTIGALTVTTAPSAAVTSGIPVNTTLPAITVANGNYLCDLGRWSPAPDDYLIMWQRDTLQNGIYADLGVTTVSYQRQTGDIGSNLRCSVTTDSAAGTSAAAYSLPLLVPADAVVVAGGLTMTADVVGTLTLTPRV